MTYDITDATMDALQETGRFDFEREMPGPLFHDACGFLWILHRPCITPTDVQPFGCPSENEARSAFGDR